MNSKKILNMKVKDLVNYCDNHNCSECELHKICIFYGFNNKEHTVVSMLSANVDRLKGEK